MGQLVHVRLEGDNVWKDLQTKGDKVIHYQGDWDLAALERGMESGRTSLALRLDLPDGKIVVAETSLRAFYAACMILKGRFHEEISQI